MLKKRCNYCDMTYSIPVTEEQVDKWRDGMLIQNAMPEVSNDLRELLISGTCGSCWEVLWSPMEMES